MSCALLDFGKTNDEWCVLSTHYIHSSDPAAYQTFFLLTALTVMLTCDFDIGVWYGRVEQVREGISRDGLEGNFMEQGLNRASRRDLNISTDEAFKISSGNLFQYGTTQPLNAWWRWRVLHHCWWTLEVWPLNFVKFSELGDYYYDWILEVWPRAPSGLGQRKTASYRKSRRTCIILRIQIRSPQLLYGLKVSLYKTKSFSTWGIIGVGTTVVAMLWVRKTFSPFSSFLK